MHCYYTVINFERVKVMIAIAVIHLCFGVFPSELYKNTLLLILFGHNSLIKQNDSAKLDNTIWKGFRNIFINIWL